MLRSALLSATALLASVAHGALTYKGADLRSVQYMRAYTSKRHANFDGLELSNHAGEPRQDLQDHRWGHRAPRRCVSYSSVTRVDI